MSASKRGSDSPNSLFELAANARRMPLLITPSELATELASGRGVRLLDVRWRLNLPEGRPAYLAGHLPGAVYVDLER